MYAEKIVDVKFFGNFKKNSQKWPTQDLSNIERNKVMKNQLIQGIPHGLVNNNHLGDQFESKSMLVRSGQILNVRV